MNRKNCIEYNSRLVNEHTHINIHQRINLTFDELSPYESLLKEAENHINYVRKGLSFESYL